MDRAYLVVPFERVGITIGPRQAFVFDQAAPARVLAQRMASQCAGVALLERQIDPETGDDRDTLIAGIGAVPPSFPAAGGWSLRLS